MVVRARARVVCGDGVRFLRAMDDDSAVAVVTDPPWNRGKPYGASPDDLPEDCYVHWLNGVLRDCGRVSRGPVVAFLGRENLDRLPRLLEHTGLAAAAVLDWQRSPGVNEAVAVLTGGCDVPDGARLRTAQRALATAPEPDDPGHGHPCPKPLAAVEPLVRLLDPRVGVVLDPFAGTGTTLVAARRAGLRSVGVELDPWYCAVAARRLAAPGGYLGSWETGPG